jgi:protein PsiE
MKRVTRWNERTHFKKEYHRRVATPCRSRAPGISKSKSNRLREQKAGQAAICNGFARLIRSRSRGLCSASHRSLRRCTFSQNSGLLPNTRARMSAVGAVTLRRLLQSSFTCLRCTPMAAASPARRGELDRVAALLKAGLIPNQIARELGISKEFDARLSQRQQPPQSNLPACRVESAPICDRAACDSDTYVRQRDLMDISTPEQKEPKHRRELPERPMSDAVRQLNRVASNLHRDMRDTADTIGSLLVDAFHLLALFSIGATTVWSAATVFIGMASQGHASLSDILLLFIFLEFGAMVGIYFKTTRLPVRYLIYIAMTALGRVLVELVGAEHRTGMFILVIAGAILLLSFAVLVLRFGESD